MARRRLNKKLVTGLTLALMVVFAVVGVVLISKLPQTDPTPYVQQAIEAYRAGNLKKAMQAYVQAWNVSRHEPRWLVAAGDVAKDLGDARVALQSWQRAVLVRPAYGQAQERVVSLELELAKMLPSANRCTELFRQARALLDIESERQNALGHYACGWALLQLGEADLGNLETDRDRLEQARRRAADSQGELTPTLALAEDYLKRAYELDPNDAQVVASLAEFYERQAGQAKRDGRSADQVDRLYAQAEQLHKDLLQRNPKLVAAHVNYAQFLMRRGRMEQALSVAREAAGLRPEGPDVQLLLARIYIEQGKREQAEAAFKQARTVAPQRLEVYRQLGLYYHRIRQDAQAALRAYQEALALPLDRTTYRGFTERRTRFVILIQAGEAALGAYGQAPEQKQQLLELAESYHDEAVRELGENAWTYRLKGMILRARGQLNEAIAVLEKADRAWGGVDTRTKLVLADLYARTGRPGLAEKALLAVLQIIPDHVPTKLLLASVDNRLNRPQRALALADEVLQAQPNNRQALLVKIEAYRQLGQTSKIEPLRKRLAGESPLERVRLAQILLAEERQDQAEQQLLEVLKEDPAYEPALRLLISLYASADRLNELDKVYEAARRQSPNSRLVQALSVLLSSQQDRNKRIREFIEQNPDPFARQLQLTSFFLGQQQLQEALKHLDQAEKLRPDDQTVIEWQFRLALRQQDWSRAERYVARAKQYNTDAAGGSFYQGRLLLAKAGAAQEAHDQQSAQKHLNAAVDLLEAGLRQFPSDTAAHLYLGMAYASLGKLDEARAAFEAALELNPNSGLAHKALAQILAQAGQDALARQHLEEAIRLIPQDPWVQQRRQELLEEQNPQAGIKRREALRQQDPTDVANLRRLAWLYEKAGQKQKARECYEQAWSNAPTNMMVAAEVAAFYRRLGNPQRAEVILKQLVRNVPKDQKATAELLVARHFRQIGQLDEADKAYKVAVALNPSASVCHEMAEFCVATRRLSEATDWLRRALEAARAEKRTIQERNIHRRLIDLLLALFERQQAETEITAYLQAHPSDAWGFILQGRLQTLQNKIRPAVRSYKRALELDPNSALAHFQLGRLYWLLWQYTQSIEHL
ncbi:MAG: tetratricopeptide repeat protein, partial [Phycisphaerae bacterium]